MIYLPATLPDLFIDLCWKLRKEFNPSSRQWKHYAEGVNEAVENGVELKAARTLLLGLEAGQILQAKEGRTSMQNSAASDRERIRHKNRQPVFNYLFELSKTEAKSYSIQGIKQTQSLIIYGFILHHGYTRVHKPHWEPLSEAISSILIDDEKLDPEGRVYQRVRQRVHRIRKEEPQDEIQNQASSYFRGVYAILDKSRRVRTLAERTK